MLTPSEIDELRRKSKETTEYAFKAFSEPPEARQARPDEAPAAAPAQDADLVPSPQAK
jgi:hypothetical protein